MRRAGKTYACYQRIQELLATGIDRSNILYPNFEDDRLFGFELANCQSILDVFYGQRPEKKSKQCYFFFDEIQNVPNWERFIRRLMDTEQASVHITGSSAKLLSAEIAMDYADARSTEKFSHFHSKSTFVRILSRSIYPESARKPVSSSIKTLSVIAARVACRKSKHCHRSAHAKSPKATSTQSFCAT